MKALFTIVLLSFTAFSAQAQYARLQAGILLGYDNAGFGSWNQSIEYYNINIDSLSSPVDLFRTGGKIGAFGQYTLLDGIAVLAELEYQRYGASTDEGDPFLRARFNQLQFSAGASLYPFLLFPVQLPPRLKENFYMQLTGGYGFRTVASVTYEDSNADEADSVSLAEVDGKGGLHLGVGAGYHIYLTDKISISPTFRLTFSPMARFSGLAANVTSISGAAVDPSLSDNQTMLQTSFQIRAAYNILNRLPLCPINSCSVRSQHRHRELGEQVYRGNTHDKKQNPRYGQRHRGQRRKKVSDPNKGNK